MNIKYPHISVKLLGANGNAFVVLGKCTEAARKAGLTKDQIDEFRTEAMEGNYDHLLQTCMKYFDVQ